MSKAYLLSFLFLIVEIIAFIPLTIEVFGDMDPNVLTISAIVFLGQEWLATVYVLLLEPFVNRKRNK